MEQIAVSKLNLYLKVIGRRPDGYHRIESVFLPLDEPSDRVTLELLPDASGSRCRSDDPELPEDLENIAGKAASAYFCDANLPDGADIAIEKRIPSAAGMGGGSSDAAAVLTMLEHRFAALGPGKLRRLALSLGADVPFFLSPRVAEVSGIGEIIRTADCPPVAPPLLVVDPRFPVSAKWAYAHLPEECKKPDALPRQREVVAALRERDWQKLADNIHNDLAAPLYHKFPLLSLLRDFMEKNGALRAEITGSGPTMYALLPDFPAAEDLEKRLWEHFGADSLRCFHAGKKES